MSQTKCALPIAVALLALWVASPAASKIYRCTGPDGKVLFTGDASQCPGQEAHQTTGRIQSMGPSTSSAPPSTEAAPTAPAMRPAAPRRPAYDPDAEEAQAAVWRGKKQKAERDLARARKRLPAAKKVAGWCNRGDSVYRTDDMGIRRDVPCEDLQADYAELQKTIARLETYLDEGLEEECRQAGCLPGWVR